MNCVAIAVLLLEEYKSIVMIMLPFVLSFQMGAVQLSILLQVKLCILHVLVKNVKHKLKINKVGLALTRPISFCNLHAGIWLKKLAKRKYVTLLEKSRKIATSETTP